MTKRFNATMRDGAFINVEATRMELVDNTIRVYRDEELVAFVEASAVITAHLSERGGNYGVNQ